MFSCPTKVINLQDRPLENKDIHSRGLRRTRLGHLDDVETTADRFHNYSTLHSCIWDYSGFIQPLT